jgi:hypothetical protein
LPSLFLRDSEITGANTTKPVFEVKLIGTCVLLRLSSQTRSRCRSLDFMAIFGQNSNFKMLGKTPPTARVLLKRKVGSRLRQPLRKLAIVRKKTVTTSTSPALTARTSTIDDHARSKMFQAISGYSSASPCTSRSTLRSQAGKNRTN